VGALFVLFWVIGQSTTLAAPAMPRDPVTPEADLSMDEGDFHSGPDGYSPNTAYPDTFYGSRGSDDDFGGHDEGDFNR